MKSSRNRQKYFSHFFPPQTLSFPVSLPFPSPSKLHLPLPILSNSPFNSFEALLQFFLSFSSSIPQKVSIHVIFFVFLYTMKIQFYCVCCFKNHNKIVLSLWFFVCFEKHHKGNMILLCFLTHNTTKSYFCCGVLKKNPQRKYNFIVCWV